ncbi:MAG TPA: HEPN domain-containing protein [Bryobacteraceae bacterium]|nr:HEPN domain-containing protein [Bryobacteraceae bacterium]HPT24945.1 HEPN domain-containing protein [Bryobacteraceae bacterium]
MSGRLSPSDPREWLRRSQSSLLHARSKVEGVCLEDLCFDAQQAAEKAIKAVLVARKAQFPYVHDIDVLLSALTQAGEALPVRVLEAAKLTPFAVEARYPSVAREVTDAQYDEALRLAEDVCRWAEARISAT